jgi:perosamine synthetase
MALYTALKACGIESGKVLAPALTMIATTNAIRMAGAEPLFIDVDETGCMDIQQIENALINTKDIKSVIYVSFNGRSNNIRALAELCKKAEVYLIEDACQSFGSRYDHQFLGTFGDIGCYSLSPYKTITTGQGGLVVTNDNRLAENIRQWKDHGRLYPGVDIHPTMGINAKYTDLQAVVGLTQLKEIQNRIEKKKSVYYRYLKKLFPINKVTMIYTEMSNTVPWMVDIYVEDRDELKDYLFSKGIATRLMYRPIYKQGCYAIEQELPMTEKLSGMGLWLPSGPNLVDEQINTVCYEIYKYYA